MKIYKCHFCKFVLNDLLCENCPFEVYHYLNNRESIYCLEFYYQGHIILFKLSYYNGEKLPKNYNRKMTITTGNNGEGRETLFDNHFGITPYNVAKKLPLLLTFR